MYESAVIMSGVRSYQCTETSSNQTLAVNTRLGAGRRDQSILRNRALCRAVDDVVSPL